MKTGFECVFSMFDTTANSDSTPTTPSNQEFGDISEIKNDILTADYGTLEQDFFLLDGSMNEMPETPEDVVFFSNVMSGPDGSFEQNPTISITFTENHSSVGLTFYFLQDYPTEMIVKWYSGAVCISQKSFAVDSLKYFANNQVSNYTRLEIEFTKARPYRYVKLRYLEYGTEIKMGGDGLPVEDSSLIEECDPVSDKIPVNKLSFKVIDSRDDFNVGNAAGMHQVLQQEQEALAYETVDGARMLLGKFYLSEYSTEKNVTNMSFEDLKGLLGRRKFRSGKVYTGELAGTVIDSIMSEAGITTYEVSEEVANTPLYGWLKIQTCRSALREVAFACGAVVDTSRSDVLKIYRPNRLVKSVVRRDRKFSTAYDNKDYISDVSVKYPVYTLDEAVSEIAKGTYAAGTYTIDLSSPAANMTINTGEIVEQTDNYVTFTVPEQADVVISGQKYKNEELTVVSSVEKVSAGMIRASKDYSCSLVNGELALAASKRILEYLGLRLGLKIKFINNGEYPYSWSEIYNSKKMYGNFVAGFEKVTTSLTGGFISTAELRGYYKLVSDHYYTGELYAGEGVGDI